MKFNKQHKPWLCATAESNRPMLTVALVKRLEESTGRDANCTPGIIVCTDGFCLVGVPCILEDGDVEGLVLAKVLKQAARTKGANRMETVIKLNATEVTLEDGTKIPRLNADTESGTFPNYEVVIPRKRLTTAPASFSIDPAILRRVLEALGAEAVVITSSKRDGLIMVETKAPENGSPVPPFGSLMPFRRQGPINDFQWDEIPEEIQKTISDRISAIKTGETGCIP